MRASPRQLYQASNDALGIEWDDGQVCIYSWQLLRDACPCAWCEDARAKGRPVTTSRQPRPSEVTPVGSYAWTFQWDDGHTVGIYSHDYLRSLCPESPQPMPD